MADSLTVDDRAGAAPKPPARPAQPQPLSGGKLVLGTIALSLAPHERAGFVDRQRVDSGDLGRPRRSAQPGTWVITSFAVANAISVPLTGWLTTRFGAVRLFITSILLFVLSSWLCGVAPNLETLLAARILQAPWPGR